MDRSPGGGDRSNTRTRPAKPGGLSGRLVLAAAVLVILIGASFAALFAAIVQLRNADEGVVRSVDQIQAAERLEQLLVDMETGLRGYVITREERFLEPWNNGRAAFPAEAREAQRQAADNPVQAARLQAISDAGISYIEDYGVPLIESARRGDPSASSVATTEAGKDRVDGLRALFAEYSRAERAIYLSRQEAADAATNVAALGAAIGLGASVLLIVLFAGYLARTVVRPVTRAAQMAGRLAAGELSTRMPETGAAEIGNLERSFNSLAASLEESHAAERRLLDQQSALRRVATLVAQGRPPDEVFRAVVREVGELLPSDLASLARFETDESLSTVASWVRGQGMVAANARLPLTGDNVPVRVWRTNSTARMDSYDEAAGPIAERTREAGIRASVGCPVLVTGRFWGVMTASSRVEHALPADAEAWLTAFTELVATAISNADARAELAASRARVVAAADEARRRIERNLHDGAQQRLVSLGLSLRALEAVVPPEDEHVRGALRQLAGELNGVTDELREISRGIYPAILSRGGLNSAIRTLARRSSVPVELELGTDASYPEPVQVAGYYLVAEALTNATKYANARKVRICVAEGDGALRLTVEDDGVGGADPGRGSGLIGLRDRVEALGGRLEVVSPPGGGTRLVAEFPVRETPAA